MRELEKKIRVAMFVDSFGAMDGVVNVVKQYSKLLSDRAEVTIVAPKTTSKEDNSIEGVEILRCASIHVPIVNYDYGVPELDGKFLKEIKDRRFDIIHLHSPFNLGKLAIKIGKELDIPVVATFHSQFKQDFKLALGLDSLAEAWLKDIVKVFNACYEVWPVNSKVQEILYEYGYVGNSTVITNATEMKPLEGDYRSEVDKMYGLKADQPMFLFVGRIITLKNVLYIVEVMRALRERGFDFKMVYVGDGYAKAQVKSLIKKYKLEDYVILPGKLSNREDLAKVYQRANLVVFPSYYDADSLCKYEAASQSTPTIFAEGAATIGGVKDGVDGYVASGEDEYQFADRIIEIFEDKSKYLEVCKNTYDRLYHTWTDVVDKVYDNYLRVISEYHFGK
ncbi:MAG: glycosyltransferase [Clostridia bacterium]|nr:glycosyltransferase [Clostridia bacterium]